MKAFVTVHSSASWRLPLFIQLIPAVILLIGALFNRILPPSPRLLVVQERYDEAAAVLRMLRGDEDVLVQVFPSLLPSSALYVLTPSKQLELLEMRTEVLMMNRVASAHAPLLTSAGRKPGLASTMRSEMRIWARLFGPTYRKRTAIGIMMMVFQRKSGCARRVCILLMASSYRVVGYKCTSVLWSNAALVCWAEGRYHNAFGRGWGWNCTGPGCATSHPID